MSYRRFIFLTLPAAFILLAPLHGQDDSFDAACGGLSSPYSHERVDAVNALATLPGDIAGRLRVAYKAAAPGARAGLLQAARVRRDSALVEAAIHGLSDADVRIQGASREYLLSLDDAALPANPELTEVERAVYAELLQFRLRRDISAALLDTMLKPGKFFGQFDALRARAGRVLDDELLRLFTMDPAYALPLDAAVRERLAQGTDAPRMFSPAWRRLQASPGYFEQALRFMYTGALDPEDAAAMSRIEAAQVVSACEVAGDLRAACMRALAQSDAGPELAPVLRAAYAGLREPGPEPRLQPALNLDAVRVEMELALARFGDSELLDARMATLRTTIERVSQVQGQNFTRPAARPDLVAQNELAHLLLRAGDCEAAEKEWQSMLNAALEASRNANEAQRSSLSSFSGAVYYNLACAQALQLKLTKAMESLERAHGLGYRDFAWILEDGDLESLRQTPRFRAWFGEFAPPALVARLSGSADDGAAAGRTGPR